MEKTLAQIVLVLASKLARQSAQLEALLQAQTAFLKAVAPDQADAIAREIRKTIAETTPMFLQETLAQLEGLSGGDQTPGER